MRQRLILLQLSTFVARGGLDSSEIRLLDPKERSPQDKKASR
jgi:hypothetical protein